MFVAEPSSRAATFPTARNCSSCSPSSLPGVRAGSSFGFPLLGFFLGWCFGFLVGFGLGVVWCVGFPLVSWQWGVRTGSLVCIVCRSVELRVFFPNEVFP